MTVVRVFINIAILMKVAMSENKSNLKKVNTGMAHILLSHIIDRGRQTERNECVRMFPMLISIQIVVLFVHLSD